MDKAELQYVIVARRCQLPSICFIACAIGSHNKNIGVISVAIEQKQESIGFVALAIGKIIVLYSLARNKSC